MLGTIVEKRERKGQRLNAPFWAYQTVLNVLEADTTYPPS